MMHFDAFYTFYILYKYKFRNGELEVTGGGTHYPMTTWEIATFDLQVKLPDDLDCDHCMFQVHQNC
jgi:hypothetical protein